MERKMSFFRKVFGCKGTRSSPENTKKNVREPGSRFSIIRNINKSFGCFRGKRAMPPLVERTAPPNAPLQPPGSNMPEPKKKTSDAQAVHSHLRTNNEGDEGSDNESLGEIISPKSKIFNSLWRRLTCKKGKKGTKDGSERHDQGDNGLVPANVSIRTPKGSAAPIGAIEPSGDDDQGVSEPLEKRSKDENIVSEESTSTREILRRQKLASSAHDAVGIAPASTTTFQDDKPFSLEILFCEDPDEDRKRVSVLKEAIAAYKNFLKEELAPAIRDAVTAFSASLLVLSPDDRSDDEPFFLENLFLENPDEDLSSDSVSKDCLMVKLAPSSSLAVVEKTAPPLERIEPFHFPKRIKPFQFPKRIEPFQFPKGIEPFQFLKPIEETSSVAKDCLMVKLELSSSSSVVEKTAPPLVRIEPYQFLKPIESFQFPKPIEETSSVAKDCLMVKLAPSSSSVVEKTAPLLERIESYQFPKRIEPYQFPKRIEPFQFPKRIEPFQFPKGIEPFQFPKRIEPFQFPKPIEETSSVAKAYNSFSERNDQEDAKSYGEIFESVFKSFVRKLNMGNVEDVNGMVSAGMPDQRGGNQQAGPVSERTPKHKNFVRKAISKWNTFRKKKAAPEAENLPYASLAPPAAENLQYASLASPAAENLPYASVAPPAPPAPSLDLGTFSYTDIFLSDPDENKEVSASKFSWLCIRKKADMKRRMNKKQVQARFKIVGELGRGAYGNVVKIRQKRGRKEFALKEMRGTPVRLANVPNEINAIKLTSEHPLFVRFYSFYSFSYQDGTTECGIITELFPSRNLNELRRSQTVGRLEAKFILFQLGVALKFLHSLNIIHGDVKPENLLINKNMEIKLIDLGLCRKGPYSDLDGGTKGYQAPEIVCLPQKLEDRKPYTFTVDYYSCGALLLHLLYGFPAAETGAYLEVMGVLVQFCLGTRRWALPIGHPSYKDKITKEDLTFVVKLLNDSPEARPNDKTFLTDVYFESLPERFKAVGCSSADIGVSQQFSHYKMT